jgi:ABC-type antimicrobial peptide transport system permease subunit
MKGKRICFVDVSKKLKVRYPKYCKIGRGGFRMMDLWIFFGIAIVSGIVALLGFFVLITKRVTEPTRELFQRIESLEKEIDDLKSKNK